MLRSKAKRQTPKRERDDKTDWGWWEDLSHPASQWQAAMRAAQTNDDIHQVPTYGISPSVS